MSEAGGAIGRLLRCILGTGDNPPTTKDNDDDDDQGDDSAVAVARAQSSAGRVQGQGLGLVMADVLPLLQRQVVSTLLTPTHPYKYHEL